MSRNDGRASSTSSDAASRSTAAADVSFTPRKSPHESRIPRWRRRSSRGSSNSNSGSNSNSTLDIPASEKAKGKRVSSYNLGEGSSRTSTPSRPKKSGGFLLESAFANNHSTSHERAHHRSHLQANTHIDKRKLAAKRISDASSQRSSPLSREVSNDRNVGSEQASSARPPSLDPAQLVQMALNLSESRRRHVSSTLPVPISPAGTRRVVSGLAATQAGLLNTITPGYSSNERAHSVSDSQRSSQQYGDTVPGTVDGFDVPVFTFTPATLSRAEKARRYFELASEHRRLLEHLPPLKTDSSAPGNYAMKATSTPGSAHYDVIRVPSNTAVKRGLGRPYNPLQALRNRRLRNRERRPLTAPPDAWQETNRIKEWIDDVETASKEPLYRPGEDQVRLPTFSGEVESAGLPRSDNIKRHRRNDTVSSVITRPENGWMIEPAELLADTYWVERDDNKTVIEDKHGNRIFPNRARLSVEVPRHSKESVRRHEPFTDKGGAQDESDDDGRLRNRRKNIINISGRLRRHHASRSASVSSSSSNEGRKPPAMHFGHSDGGDENIGPLERHMNRIISREERGELSSPEILSPDHWDSQNEQLLIARDGTTNRDSGQVVGSRPSVDIQLHRRARSADGRVGSIDHGVTQTNDFASNSTASPTLPHVAAMDHHSSANTRPMTSEHKMKSSNLPIFRSRSKERNHIEHSDFADNYGAQLSPVLSRESVFLPPRSSLDSSRPMQMKRKGTNESITGSTRRPHPTNAVAEGSIKESANAVGRRLGRIGELVKNEGTRLGDRLRGARDRDTAPGMIRALSDNSETEHAERSNARANNADEYGDVSPRHSMERHRPKPKYHTSGLPTFKSPAARDSSATDNSGSEQAPLILPPRSRLEVARAADSDFPVPPTIILPESDSVSDSDHPASRAVVGRPKSASQTHLSFGASPATTSGERRGNLTSGHEGRRHWSISDPSHQIQPQLVEEITARDIARVRALLLASGIKAQEIYNKASTTRDTPLPLITKVAEITGQKLDSLNRKEEDLVAGRLLSETISSTSSEFETILEHFQSTTVKDLGAQLDELSHRAADQLTKLVHETSDEVDTFNVELTTKQPQEVKRVDEAVDEMFRQRRRQFRLVRRTGFKMLEWLVLGIMWWAWFVVFLFNTVRKGIVTILAALRWLLWF